MRHTPWTRSLVPLVTAAALATLAGCGSSTASPGATRSAAPPASRPAASAPAPAPSPTAVVPAETVVSSRVTYLWHWPNDVNHPDRVPHPSAVPPVPTLIAIGAGDHPGAPGERHYNRMSFTFTGGFPSYQFAFTGPLVSDPSGRPVPLAGDGPLTVTFRQAQAHNADGRPSVVSQPPERLGFSRMVSWALAGDFEGVLTYGIGIAMDVPHSNPQYGVRAVEVEKVTAQGQHLYIVAVDVDATGLNRG